MGFSPDLVAGIYVGFDQPKSLGEKETGGSVALPGFIKFMEKALKDKTSRPFNVPAGIDFISVNAKTGLPPQPGDTGRVVLEAFKTGEYPGMGSETLSASFLEQLINTPAQDNALPFQKPIAEPKSENIVNPYPKQGYLPSSRYNKKEEGLGGLY
ncbi:MAG: hypothetical protein WCJ33_08540 [Pseudomonadota bacterium]